MAALSGERIEIGRGRAEPGSAGSIVMGYLASDNFKAIKSPVTKDMHRCTLERFAAKHGALPFRLLGKQGIECAQAARTWCCQEHAKRTSSHDEVGGLGKDHPLRPNLRCHGEDAEV